MKIVSNKKDRTIMRRRRRNRNNENKSKRKSTKRNKTNKKKKTRRANILRRPQKKKHKENMNTKEERPWARLRSRRDKMFQESTSLECHLQVYEYVCCMFSSTSISSCSITRVLISFITTPTAISIVNIINGRLNSEVLIE